MSARRVQEASRASQEQSSRDFASISDVFIDRFLFGYSEVFLGARDARSDPSSAPPRLSNIAGARRGFLLLLLRCCLEIFETFSRYGTRPKRSQLKPPGEPAQRASKGISDPTGLLC